MGFIVHNGIISAVRRSQFLSDRLSFVNLRGRWCDIIVRNVYALTEVKSGNTKDNFYMELERVFD
jgi:hypothetical protein